MLRSQTTSRSTRGKKRSQGRRRSKVRPLTPVWQDLLRIAQTIPESDLHKFPTDISVNHDHYLYGSHSE